jgi:hypothetical protein
MSGYVLRCVETPNQLFWDWKKTCSVIFVLWKAQGTHSFVPIDFRPSAVGKRPHQIPSMGELGVLLDYETLSACDAKVMVSGISGMGSWMSSL